MRGLPILALSKQMWLLLCSQYDPAAMWAYYGLRRRGLLPLELVTAETLLRGCKWEHRIGESATMIRITLADGRVIDSERIRGTLNRLTHVPMQKLAGTPDFDYATQEYAAFFMSWLYSLPGPILNRTMAMGLSGAWRHPSEWVSLAAKAGLPTPPYKQTSEDNIDETVEVRRLVPAQCAPTSVITVGTQVFGPPVAPALKDGCLRLAKLADTGLLGIDFAAVNSSSQTVFAGATPSPDLRMGGERLLDALAAELYQPNGSVA